jgi:tRNA A37 threonylcarbamoyladenosine modification protein TsaB
MPAFFLEVSEDRSTLSLREGGRTLGTKTWPERRDMSERLLAAIAEILEKTGLSPEAVTGFTVESDTRETFTSRRIAEVVARVYTFGIQPRT